MQQSSEQLIFLSGWDEVEQKVGKPSLNALKAQMAGLPMDTH